MNGQLHVVFGTGPIGLAVVQELVALGKAVRAVNRSGAAPVPNGVQVLSGDAKDLAFARRAASGATVVYNCLNPPYHLWPELFPPLQRSVLEAASATGAKLVSMENLYLYGPTHGRPIGEELPYASTGKKGRTRARMAEDLLRAHEAGTARVVIGRASDYFGPNGRLSMAGDRVFSFAVRGKAAQVVGNPDVPHTYTYIPDIARALVLLGERDEALGQAWHIPSERTITTREFVTMVFEAAGTAPRISVLSPGLLRFVGLFSKVVRELKETVYQFQEPFVVDHRKFERMFGNPATPLGEAIGETVKWFREHPRR